MGALWRSLTDEWREVNHALRPGVHDVTVYARMTLAHRTCAWPAAIHNGGIAREENRRDGLMYHWPTAASGEAEAARPVHRHGCFIPGIAAFGVALVVSRRIGACALPAAG